MAFEESGREGTAESLWHWTLDISDPNRCTSPATLQTWTAERTEGGLIFWCGSEPWQTPKEKRYKTALQPVFGRHLKHHLKLSFSFSSFFLFGLIFWEPLREDYSFKSHVMAAISQSANMCLTLYYMPSFLPRVQGELRKEYLGSQLSGSPSM